MKYSIPFEGVPTFADAGLTWLTVAALEAPNVNGNRFRLLAVRGGAADPSPADSILEWRIMRVGSVIGGGGAGTPGIPILPAAMPKFDSRSRDTDITGGVQYDGAAGEPTGFETNALFEFAHNLRGAMNESLLDVERIFQQDQLCALQARSGVAGATLVTGSLDFEQF